MYEWKYTKNKSFVEFHKFNGNGLVCIEIDSIIAIESYNENNDACTIYLYDGVHFDVSHTYEGVKNTIGLINESN